jgi:hypothetical protein
MAKPDESAKDERTDQEVLRRIEHLASETHAVRPPDVVESY